ncbi:MAG: hypothetical protein AMJ75_11930 [Phycisphaerae bacterium SM1_79]|nr:MAG: hypothetical protein AMJ75_11930 [Phycisphaerae bacterium SM1_79]
MTRNKHKLNKFYRRLIEEESISHKEALVVCKALYKQVAFWGIINSENFILERLQNDLRMAKAINGLTS